MCKLSVPSLAVIVAVLMTASAAQAGGVIIDGRSPGTPSPGPTDPTGADTDPSDTSAPPTQQSTPLTPTEQQIYLWAAMVLNGHDAASQPGAPPTPGAPPASASKIIEDLQGTEDLGGCAAVPASALSMLVGLLLLRRRRRV